MAAILPCFAPGTTSARFSASRQHRQSIWEARIKMILLYHAWYLVYVRSWLSARLSVATKKTRSGHGQ